MTSGPVQLTFEAEIAAASLAEAIGAIIAAKPPGLRGWRIGSEKLHKAAPDDAALAGATSVELGFEKGAAPGYITRFEPPNGSFAAVFSHDTESLTLRETTALLDALAASARALLTAGVLRHALVRRLEGGLCLPDPPVAGLGTHIIVVPQAEIDAAYAYPAACLAAFDSAEPFGGHILLTRGLDAPGNPAFLKHILPGHMAMVRAAPPAEIRFAGPIFAAGEFALLNAGDPTLSGVGYFADTGIYEFAGHLPDGTDLRPIDLMTAWRVAATGKVEIDGTAQPVREVRAVFMDEDQARRAAPLLSAAGVAAWWTAPDGTDRKIAAASPAP